MIITPNDQYELAAAILNAVVGQRFAALGAEEQRDGVDERSVTTLKVRFEEAFKLRESLPILDATAIDKLIRDLGREVQNGATTAVPIALGAYLHSVNVVVQDRAAESD